MKIMPSLCILFTYVHYALLHKLFTVVLYNFRTLHGFFKVFGLLGNMVSMVVIMSLMFATIICYIHGLVTYNTAVSSTH